MAANQKRAPLQLGFVPATPNSGVATLALSNTPSNILLAFGFRPDQAKTLNRVQVYVPTITGSLNASGVTTDLQCDIYSSSSGAPSASLASSTTLNQTGQLGTGGTAAPFWLEFQGFSLSMSPAVQYWIVLRNNNSTPATNYPTYQWGGGGTVPGAANGSGFHLGSAKQQYSVTTWGSGIACICGYRLQFSDGTYGGFPVQAIGGGADKANGTSEVGVNFTVPSGAVWNVRGLSFYTNISGLPTGNLQYKLYTGSSPSLVATTQGLINSDIAISTAAYNPDYFASNVTLNPGTVVTCTISSSATESGSNGYIMGQEYKFANDPNTQALMPFEGTLQKATWNGTIWSYPTTTASIFPVALLLDSAGEFASAGGGVPRIGPALIGGICG